MPKKTKKQKLRAKKRRSPSATGSTSLHNAQASHEKTEQHSTYTYSHSTKPTKDNETPSLLSQTESRLIHKDLWKTLLLAVVGIGIELVLTTIIN